MMIDIAFIESIELFDDFGAPRAGAVKNLPIRMFAVTQRFYCLRVNRLIRHDSQHKAIITLQPLAMDFRYRESCQNGFTAAGGDF